MRGEHRQSRGDRATPTSQLASRQPLTRGDPGGARRGASGGASGAGGVHLAGCSFLMQLSALSMTSVQRQRVEHVPRPSFPVLLRNDSGEAPPTTLRIIQAWAWSCRVSDGALNTFFHDQALTSSSDA